MDERVKDIEQVADLIRGIRVAMLTTVDGDGELHSRPMATQTSTSTARCSSSPPGTRRR